VYRENYKCAVDALEQVVANDSSKADSSFFLKITVMAGQQPDTARLLKWSQRGYRKYPTNLSIEKQLLAAYTLSGMTDSAIAITRDLMVKDPAGAVAPALAAAQTLQGQKRIDEAMPFLDFVVAKGDPNSKQAAATVLLNGALPLLQPPQDFDKAGALLRKVTTWADPAGRVYPIANYYLGLSILQQIAKVDPEAEKQKSCELAKKEESMAADAAQALKGGASYKPDDVAKFQKYLDGLKPRVASMQKAYCK
jgi:tetratricopeptide (TPR) repeat protein